MKGGEAVRVAGVLVVSWVRVRGVGWAAQRVVGRESVLAMRM